VSPVAKNPRNYLDPPSGTQHQTTTSNLVTSDLSALILEYDGAIRILEDGLRNNWPVERYLYGTPIPGSANTQVERSRGLVREVLMPLQRPRMIWDERPPSNVEILRALEGLRSQRGLLVQIEARQAEGGSRKDNSNR
jgi:hypothetical protein